jgi:hypothetical protein
VNIPEMASLSIIDTLKAISDDKSLVLFSTVALSSGRTRVLINRLELTRKQYYSRMSGLVKAGLIIRRNGNYFLTSFGKMVYQVQILIGKAVQNYWKLKAIDSIESSSYELTTEERSKIIDTLIVDIELKQILLIRDNDKDNGQPLIAPRQFLDPTKYSQPVRQSH